MTPRASISVLIPCLNEERFIGGILENIAGQTYPAELIEVLVIDGGSSDQTRAIVAQWERRDKRFKLLDNPDRYVPHALNLGIRAASGELIVIMGAHAAYPPDYLSKLEEGLQSTGALNVGGVCLTAPRSEAPRARAIAAVLRHPLGVGNSLFRIGVDRPTEVDTVPFGCYPRGVFETYGLFDERLLRNQDIEFNKRIYNSGGKILLLPDVQCTYFARDTFRALWQNNFQNGLWVIRTAKLTRRLSSLSLRHFVPLGFVCYLALAALCSFFGLFAALALLILYLFLTGAAAFRIAWREGSALVFPLAWAGFPILHLSYGLGSLQGLWELAKEKIIKKPIRAGQ